MKYKLFPLFCGLALTLPALAAPKVISSIYPLQQIANAIVGEPTELLADSYLSPHDYTMTPTNVRAIHDAALFVWIGDAMMPQLHPYTAQRQANHKRTITASRLPDIHLITGRETHNHHAHSDHAHHHHEDEAHDKTQPAATLTYDPHLWLSTDNARVIAKAIAESLSQIDPDNKHRYAENLNQFINTVAQTKAQIADSLHSNPLPAYFVFHDAYHYFEDEFGIRHTGVIRAHAGQVLRTKHLSNLQKQLEKTPNACLFREPQFQSPLIDKLATSDNVTVATLDPVGYRTDKDAGQSGYPAILSALATQLQRCGQP